MKTLDELREEKLNTTFQLQIAIKTMDEEMRIKLEDHLVIINLQIKMLLAKQYKDNEKRR